jgi:hypothetical protein
LKPAKTIEESAPEWLLDEADITTLLERLSGMVEYVGRGYRTTEVKEMIDTSLMGGDKTVRCTVLPDVLPPAFTL